MHTLGKNIYVLALCLSALAGCVDAIGFMYLGGYFISFMSGNSTRLAVHLADGDTNAILLLGGIIVLFVMGAMLGMLVRHRAKASSAAANVLIFVTFLLTSAAISFEAGWALLAIGFMTLAMGAENAILQRNGDVIGLTYMTGALVKIGQRLALTLLGQEKWTWFPYLLLWLGLISGGVIGTFLFHFMGLHGLWVAAFWAAALAIITHIGRHRLSV